MQDLPTYEQLPVIEKLGMPHAWDVFGREDEVGTLNLLTADRVREALHGVREGRIINLTLPLNLPDPPLFNRQPFRHVILSSNRNTQDDYVDGFYLQSSSQWDGLRHIRAREFGFYGGRQEEDAGPGGTKLGIGRWVEHGIVGRGVLLDVKAYLERRGQVVDPFQEFAISAQVLEEAAREQRVEIRTGDILLVRTGWMKAYMEAGSDTRASVAERRSWIGLAADEGMAAFLWNHHVAAVACDNPAVEVGPGDPAVGSLHRRLVPLLGLALGELWNFEQLSAEAYSSGRFDCCVISVPLNIPHAVGSPANAIAVI